MATRTDGARVAGLLVVAVALAASIGGCGRTRACGQGTIFVQVRTDNLAGLVNGVLVDVSVAGAAPVASTLPVSGGANGGIEIRFASAYPAGQPATVQVTLENDGVPVAQRTLSTTLSPGCSALVVDFSADAGVVPGTGGMGGTIGSGGEAGGAGGANVGGEAGGGAGGIGFAGQGGGGNGGAGGATLGAGGTTPGAGGGGTAGAGGKGGGAAGGAAGSGCVRTGPETCFNQLDDDCNGLVDCEDPACTPSATCVALDPSVGSIGTSVDSSAACPSEASVARSLFSGIDSSTCSGQCSCDQGSATLSCSATVYAFASAPECADTTATGQAAHTLTFADGCYPWTWPSSSTAASVSGIRFGAITGTPIGKCESIATNLVKGPPVWTAETKFCGVPAVGAGCGAAAACVPKPIATAGACVLIPRSQACPAGLHETDWYSSVVDSRTCACNCGAPSGGTCDPVLLEVTSSCGGDIEGYASIHNDRLCLNPALTTPGLQLNGTPIAPTCQSSMGFNGTLSVGGQQTLCCR